MEVHVILDAQMDTSETHKLNHVPDVIQPAHHVMEL